MEVIRKPSIYRILYTVQVNSNNILLNRIDITINSFIIDMNPVNQNLCEDIEPLMLETLRN